MSSSTEEITELRVDPPADFPPAPVPRLTGRWPLIAAAASASVAVVIVLVLLMAGGGAQGPETGAASIVPANALAYVNISTDGARPSVAQSLGLARRLPDYPLARAALLTRLAAIVGGGTPVDFSSQIQPWLGHEVAIAFLNTTSSAAGSLIALAVSNRARAHSFLASSGATPDGTYRGIPLLRFPTGTELAFVDGYLALGQSASVRAAIDVAAGKSSSLQNNPAYQRAASGEPSDRVLDAYASAAGVQRILVARAGALGALGVLLAKPALQAVTVSVSPADGGFRVRVHSTMDPALSALTSAPRAPFSPTLQNVAPSNSVLMLDTDGLNRAAPEVLRAAAAAGIGGQVLPLLQRLGAALAAEGINLHSLTSVFGGETAVAVTQTGAVSPGGSAAPALIIIARTNDQAQARAALATLEVPLAQLFAAPSSGPGQAPEFNDVEVDGVTTHQLSLTPGLQLDYAVFDGLVVVSTSRAGISAVIARQHSLAGTQEFRTALAGGPSQVSSLLFLDFSQLLSVAEQTGLTHSARVRALAPDLQRIRAVGMDSTSGEADTTAELFFQIP